jgi:hypothetical protein
MAINQRHPGNNKRHPLAVRATTGRARQAARPTPPPPQRLTIPFQVIGQTSGRVYALDGPIQTNERLLVSIKNAYRRCLLKSTAVIHHDGVQMCSSRILMLFPAQHAGICVLEPCHASVVVTFLIAVVPLAPDASGRLAIPSAPAGRVTQPPTYRITLPLQLSPMPTGARHE